MQSLRRQSKDLSTSQLFEKVLEKTQYIETLEAEKTAEGQDRINNIEELYSVIQEFEEEKGKEAHLGLFLESISLMTDLDSWDHGSNILTLMTMHMAKGLEFPIVYMVGLEEGIFPHSNAYTDDLNDLEEERRICYVGLTRAKERVYLSFARQRRLYGSIQHNLPSRFLNEIPAALMNSTGGHLSQNSLDDDEILYDDLVIDPDDDELKRRILFD